MIIINRSSSDASLIWKVRVTRWNQMDDTDDFVWIRRFKLKVIRKPTLPISRICQDKSIHLK